MIVRAVVLAVALEWAAAGTSSAQPREPLPRLVADIRAASLGLPAGTGWTPAVPTNTVVPGRALGLDAGAHVYVARFRAGAVGLGGTFLAGRSHTSPPDSGDTPAPTPGITTTLRAYSSQVSFNFGHGLGWSYISGGLGRVRLKSDVTEPVTGAAPVAPVDTGWAQAINYGGGARWFLNDHVAFHLDLRWHKIGSRAATGTQSALQRQSALVAGGGLSIK
jgi:opacity protein-like surface antigen